MRTIVGAAAMSGLLVLSGCGDGTSSSGPTGSGGETSRAGSTNEQGGSKDDGAGGTQDQPQAGSATVGVAGEPSGAAGNAPDGEGGEGGSAGSNAGGMPSAGEGGMASAGEGGTVNGGEGGAPGSDGGTGNQGGTRPNGGSPSDGGTSAGTAGNGGSSAGTAGSAGNGGNGGNGGSAGSAGAGGSGPQGECAKLNDGTPCGDKGSSDCDGPDTCKAGVCVPNHTKAKLACGDAPGPCEDQSYCDGAGKCLIQFLPPGSPCGDAASTACNEPDTCDGAGSCEPNLAEFATACGSNTKTACDNPDTCDDDGNCLSNYVSAKVACGSKADTECDNPDTCNGLGACQSNNEPAGKTCGSSTVNTCTSADSCSLGICQPNHASNGSTCEDCTAGIGQCDGCSTGACQSSTLCTTTPPPLSTGFASNGNQAGVMFDMTALEELTIRGFDVNVAAGPFTVNVYVTTSASSYVGEDTNAGSWTMLKSYPNVTGTAGVSGPTPLPQDLEYTLAKGQSRGFFITLASGVGQRLLIGTAVGAVRVSDGVLQLKEGISKGTGFGGAVATPRVFSGNVHYKRSLTTALTGGGGVDGVMFDVDSATNTRLRGLRVVPGVTGSFDVELWYRNGTHVSHEDSQTGWQLVDFYADVPMVAASPLRLPITTDMIFEAGSKHALYVSTEAGGSLRAITGSGVNSVVAADGFLTIREGTGKGHGFGSNQTNRRINATLEYDTCPAQ